MKIKKGDNVYVIAGKSKGKQGEVTKVLTKNSKLIVTGVNMAKHHLKPSRKAPHGGIMDMPAPIVSSNVMVMCPHCSKPVKVAYKITGDNKERICRKCSGNLDVKETHAKA